MKYIIASDFHIKYIEAPFDIERRERVEMFLRSFIGKIDGLILAGDIFDLWIEWDRVIIKNYFGLLRIFADLKESGCRLVFLQGNHDFWLSNFLKDTIGVEIYESIFTETINGKKIFVSHGDKHTNNDMRYKIIHTLIRNKLIKLIFKQIHPDISLWLGSKLSRTTVKAGSWQVNKDTENGLIATAEKLSSEYDLVVFGHSHNPLKITNGNSIYINSGDWIKHNSYCFFSEDKIEIRYWT